MQEEIYYPFERWGIPHLSALAITVLVTAVLLWWGRRQSLEKRQRICRVLALVVAVQFVGEFIWRYSTFAYGGWKNNLPLHFCSFMTVFAVIALWWRHRWACAIVFFGVLTASIQGLITPAMANGYPSLAFYVFFLSHGLLLTIALSIPLLLNWRAKGYDDVISVLIIDAYLAFIIPVNIMLGTNYGYTQGSPVEGCLLDYLGPAPWYYLWLQLPVLMVFRLMFLIVRDKSDGTERATLKGFSRKKPQLPSVEESGEISGAEGSK